MHPCLLTGEEKPSDRGVALPNVINVSKLVNGNVTNENINGLDGRIQIAVFLKYVLLDFTTSSKEEKIQFTWRRQSNKEAVLDTNGRPILDGHNHQMKKFF